MYDNLIQSKTDINAAAGRLLVSEPMMQDKSFQKTVLYLIHHSEEESLGFILNKEASHDLASCVEELEGHSFPLYIGGPVALDSLQFIHTVPELLGGVAIDESIYWNGDFQLAFDSIRSGKLASADCRFFIGYSGWGQNQLQDELNENAWLVGKSSHKLLFETTAELLWPNTIKSLGENFKTLLFVPENPALN